MIIDIKKNNQTNYELLENLTTKDVLIIVDGRQNALVFKTIDFEYIVISENTSGNSVHETAGDVLEHFDLAFFDFNVFRKVKMKDLVILEGSD
ncbi:MAG: hypothetical protein ACOCP4_04270 [Candidatus Woesearchaeota archaeon]